MGKIKIWRIFSKFDIGQNGIFQNNSNNLPQPVDPAMWIWYIIVNLPAQPNHITFM